MMMVMVPSAPVPTATESEGDDRWGAVIVWSPIIAMASVVRPGITVAPMPVSVVVVVVAPMVPVAGAEVG